MRVFQVARAATVMVCLAGAAPAAAELNAPTLAAFDRYVALTEARMAAEASAPMWLWVDRQSAETRASAAADLRAGRVVVAKLETTDQGRSIPVPDGLIHHWIGTVLIPGAPLDRVLSFIRDYPGYPAAFGPLIKSARVLESTADRYRVAMRTETHKVVTVVIDAHYDVTFKRTGESRAWVTTVARDLQEIDAPGSPDERAVPAEGGRGYVWRINTYCVFDARPEGTYEQCESISLSRGLPFGIGWMISPFVTSVPRETLEFTLGHVRSALVK